MDFPPWIDRTRPLAGALLAIVPVYLIGVVYYAGSPQTTDVGYQPAQPVPMMVTFSMVRGVCEGL